MIHYCKRCHHEIVGRSAQALYCLTCEPIMKQEKKIRFNKKHSPKERRLQQSYYSYNWRHRQTESKE